MPEHNKNTHEMLRGTMKALEEVYPGYAICFMVWEFNKPGIANYISNANRADMIKALREKANILEARADIQPGQEN